jgi:ribonuclease III
MTPAKLPLASALVLAEVARLFGLEPGAPHLDQALTHPSFANECDVSDNQRLEFLGDAVLGFCTSELLFLRFPDADEGTLTRMRAQLVNAEALAEWARQHAIADALRLGRGASMARLRESTNVLADAVEALIAAAYLDGGLDVARTACARIVEPRLATLQTGGERDPKSKLQELVQARGGDPPAYAVYDLGGPAHARWFSVSVSVGGRKVGEGRGRSKRQAEQAAAAVALDLGAWHAAISEHRGPAEPEADGTAPALPREGESTDE